MSIADRYGPWAVVLGASEGLGAAWAVALARRGISVLLAARRADRLEVVAREVRSHGVEARTVVIDLAEPGLEAALSEATGALDVGLVVYNAGYSVIGDFLDTPLDDKLRIVDINVRGPLIAAHVFGRRMAERGRGGIVLMSSLSGFQGTAMVATYAATKAFDTVLGEGLWSELQDRGVDVLVCAAGAILTPNFTEQTPQDRQGDAYPMPPEDVVEEAIAALGGGHPTVIPGRVNRLARTVFGLMPRATAVRTISRTTRSLYGSDE